MQKSLEEGLRTAPALGVAALGFPGGVWLLLTRGQHCDRLTYPPPTTRHGEKGCESRGTSVKSSWGDRKREQKETRCRWACTEMVSSGKKGGMREILFCKSEVHSVYPVHTFWPQNKTVSSQVEMDKAQETHSRHNYLPNERSKTTTLGFIPRVY